MNTEQRWRYLLTEIEYLPLIDRFRVALFATVLTPFLGVMLGVEIAKGLRARVKHG